jgi:S-formylglutathione hydrolase FrmB
VHPYRDHANLARGYGKPHPYITFLDSRASEPQNKISQGFTISTGRNAPLPSSMGLPHATLDRFRRLIRFSLVMLAALLFAAPVLAQAQSARLDCSSLFSAILGRDVAYCIALPPGYDQGTARYPVLYFLHGLFENEKSWSDHSGRQTWENLMAQGTIGKFIVVMPEGGESFYINSFDGHERYEDFFIKEFIPAIDGKYRTIARREARGISGVSMGGYGSLHLGMRHPDVFGSASAHSAALIAKIPDPLPTEGRWGFYARVLQAPFGNPLSHAYFDVNNPLTLAEHPEQFAGLKLYFDCGDQDRYGFDAGAKALDQILTSKGFPHQFVLRPGNHGWSYLDQYLHFSLEFHWQIFRQSEDSARATR